MFVGHYGVSFAVQRLDRRVPLWLLFIAVQLLDVLWAPLILLGVEQVRIVPGITATNPLDLYYMPFSHSLVAAVAWSGVAAVAYRLWRRSRAVAALLVGAAVLSHWFLDFSSIGRTCRCTTTPPRSDSVYGICRRSRSASRPCSCSAGWRCSFAVVLDR